MKSSEIKIANNGEKKKMDPALKKKIVKAIAIGAATISTLVIAKKLYDKNKNKNKSKNPEEQLKEVSSQLRDAVNSLKKFKEKEYLTPSEKKTADDLCAKVFEHKLNISNLLLDMGHSYTSVSKIDSKNNDEMFKNNDIISKKAVHESVDELKSIFKIMETVEMCSTNSFTKVDATSVYEACANGEITVEERENQIKHIKDIALFETMILPTDSDNELDFVESVDELTPNEKLIRVQNVLYERCQSGDITEDKREELIALARECFN